MNWSEEWQLTTSLGWKIIANTFQLNLLYGSDLQGKAWLASVILLTDIFQGRNKQDI